jgi:capsular exopolysaccharide synthesis family protein
LLLWYFLPPEAHTARARIQVPPERAWIVKTNTGEPSDFQNHQRNQVAFVKSHLVLRLALDDPEVAPFEMKKEPAKLESLAESLQVDFVWAPEVLSIAKTDPSPEKCLALVRAITKAYLEEFAQSRAKRRKARLQSLTEQDEKLQGRLKEAQNTRTKMIRAAGHQDAAVRTLMLTFLQQQLGMAERELWQTQSDLRKANVELKAHEAREEDGGESSSAVEAAARELVEGDKTVQQLLAEEQAARELYNNTRAVSTMPDRDDYVIQLRKDLEKKEKATAAARDQALSAAQRKMRAKAREALRTAGAVIRERVRSLEENKALLTPEVKRLHEQLEQIPDAGAALDVSQDRIAYLQEVSKKVLTEKEALLIEDEAPDPVRVLEEAFIVSGNTKAKRPLMIFGAAAGLFLSVLAAVAWLEHRTGRIVAAEDVSQATALTVLGTLPPATSASRQRATSSPPYIAESIDLVRTLFLSLVRSAQAGRSNIGAQAMRVVMVTSATAGEGKTSLVCQLASSLGRAGFRTLMIDADLRNPMLHRTFGIPNDAGLSEVLRGEVPPQVALRPTGLPDLFLLSAGKWDDATLRALAQGHAGPVLRALREHYDFVLVDSSPILPVADALLFGAHVDAVLFSVLYGVSRMAFVARARRRLSVLGVPLLGAVVNGLLDEHNAYPYAGGTKENAAPRPKAPAELSHKPAAPATGTSTPR